MNARHAARELALLSLFQLQKQGSRDLDSLTMQGLILNAVRALSDEARVMVEDAAKDLASVSQTILDVEYDHPANLNSDIDALVKPVPLPNTRETVEKIEKCLKAAEYVAEALRIPELSALAQTEPVRDYAIRLIKTIRENQSELDALINACSDDWRVERLVQMDAFILRIAAAEMKYFEDVDISVSIDEAVELAHEFSTEESFKFINGVLGAMADQLQGKPVDKPVRKPSETQEGETSHV